MTINALRRTHQLICGALPVGLAVILVIFATIHANPLAPVRWNVLAVVGLVIAVGCVIASVVVPGLVRSNTPRRPDGTLHETLRDLPDDAPLPPEAESLARGFTTLRLIRSALLEGAAVNNAVLWLIGDSLIPLAVSIVLWIALVAAVPREGELREHLLEQTRPA